MSNEKPPTDHVADDSSENAGERTEKAMEKNLKSRSTWLRLVFMIIFYVLICVAAMVTSVVVVLGFFWLLFTGDRNEQLRRTGQSLAAYIGQIIRYLTLNTDDKPFPFNAEWPSGEAD